MKREKRNMIFCNKISIKRMKDISIKRMKDIMHDI